MAVTRLASKRLARPSTAFCSCRAVGMRRNPAATSGGKAGWPPKPITAPGFTSPSSLNAAAMPRISIQAVPIAATGDRDAKVLEGTRYTARAGKSDP